MRPLLLTLHSFGPYGESESVDFSALSERGLFLITGNTGAGKPPFLTPLSLPCMEKPAEAEGKRNFSGATTPLRIRSVRSILLSL